MIVRPIQPGTWARSVPYATVAIALAGAIVFLLFEARDPPLLAAARTFYVDSGLAGIELPRYREFLQQSTDAGALQRLARLERATGRTPQRPVDPDGAIAALQSDPDFERDLRAGKFIAASDPAFPAWQRDRQRFDELSSMALRQRFALTGLSWREPWRLVTYAFLHTGLAQWLSNLAVLLLVGPFAEATAGSALFLLAYLGGAVLTGLVHLLLSNTPLLGDGGALAASVGMIIGTYGNRALPGRLLFVGRRVRVPATCALLVLLGAEALRWAWISRASIDLSADLSGLLFGVVLAALLRLRDSHRANELIGRPLGTETDWPRESALARQAREAATRLDTRRATHLFKELVDLEPQRIEHLCAYLNVALLGPDETTLQDAALRLLWLRSKSHSDELRKAFLQLTQPKVLGVLPIDEHLRLARRLVRIREDAAALRVLDAILHDDHLRQLYGRQLADCLLGIYTGYMRRRLTTLADTIRSRLITYFEAPDQIGGVPPATRPPTTIFTSSPRPTQTRKPNS